MRQKIFSIGDLARRFAVTDGQIRREEKRRFLPPTHRLAGRKFWTAAYLPRVEKGLQLAGYPLDSWPDFVEGWPRVRVPAGEGAIETAFKRTKQSALPSALAEFYGQSPIALLGSVCRELQRIVGDGEFFIDCRTAGRLIGVDHTTAWRFLKVLCADRFLAAGAKDSKAARKASRFRFIGE
jgi:DNA-binding transcriptional MerR regulator